MKRNINKIRIMLCFVLAATFLSVGIAVAAPVQWTSASGGNDHWYEILAPATSSMTWTEARDAAAAMSYLGMQGHLATLTSAGENAFVGNSAFLGTHHGGGLSIYGDAVFIGGYQADTSSADDEGWAWVTGETWSWTNWRSGQPSGAGHDYLQMAATTFDAGTWLDVAHTATVFNQYGPTFIVEYETVVPIPAAIWLFGSGILGITGLSKRKKKFS